MSAAVSSSGTAGLVRPTGISCQESGCSSGHLQRTADRQSTPVQHVPVEKELRVESLVLRRSGDVLLDREVGEEGADLGRAEISRMPGPVEADEPDDPPQVRLLRSDAVVPQPYGIAHPIEELGLRGSRGLQHDIGGVTMSVGGPLPRQQATDVSERRQRGICGRVPDIPRAGYVDGFGILQC